MADDREDDGRGAPSVTVPLGPVLSAQVSVLSVDAAWDSATSSTYWSFFRFRDSTWVMGVWVGDAVTPTLTEGDMMGVVESPLINKMGAVV